MRNGHIVGRVRVVHSGADGVVYRELESGRGIDGSIGLVRQWGRQWWRHVRVGVLPVLSGWIEIDVDGGEWVVALVGRVESGLELFEMIVEGDTSH